MDTINATYVIPAENREAVEKKLAQMARKAEQLRTTPITVVFSHDHIETWRVEKVDNCPEYGYTEYSREWLKAEVTGAAASFSGWYFRATLHHTTDGNIIAATPGYEVPREYRNAPSACHHCGTLRRRNVTYLVESKDGLQQVGRDCLQDFLGGNDPHRMAKWAEMLGAFNSWFLTQEEPSGARPVETVGLISYLTATAAVIRMDGWVSKKRASETEQTATASTTWSLLLGFPWMSWKDRHEMLTRYMEKGERGLVYSAEDVARAEEVYAWAKTTLGEGASEPENDYMHNLSVIVRSGLVSQRTGGLAASMIAAWKRATQKQEERAAAATSVSAHVGAIGERLRGVKVTLLGSHELPPTEWGTRMLVRLADDAGNIFTWFTNGDALHGSWDFAGEVRELVDGDTLYLTGTVKRHGEFGGHKQTELSRCALSTAAPEPKKAKGKKAAQVEAAL